MSTKPYVTVGSLENKLGGTSIFLLAIHCHRALTDIFLTFSFKVRLKIIYSKSNATFGVITATYTETTNTKIVELVCDRCGGETPNT